MIQKTLTKKHYLLRQWTDVVDNKEVVIAEAFCGKKFRVDLNPDTQDECRVCLNTMEGRYVSRSDLPVLQRQSKNSFGRYDIPASARP